MNYEEIESRKGHISPSELKGYIIFWANQIGNYNEGCVCVWCLADIFAKIKWAIDRGLIQAKKFDEDGMNSTHKDRLDLIKQRADEVREKLKPFNL